MSFGLNIELSFKHVWTGPTYPINNNILLFYFLNQEVCIQQFFLKQCFHGPSFMKNNFLRNSSRKKKKRKIVHSFESKREKEIQCSSQSTDLVYFFSMLQIILFWEVDVCESQNTTRCMRGEIYFKEIVSNTRQKQDLI